MGLGFSALDVMVLASLAVGGAFGAVRGFTVELFLLFAWIAGFVAVKLFHGAATILLTDPIGSVGGASVLALVVLFGGTLLIVRLVGKRLGQSTRGSFLGPFDRVLGLGFGMIKGLLAATLAFMLMSQIATIFNGGSAARPDWMTTSRTYDLLRASSAALMDAVEAGRAR